MRHPALILLLLCAASLVDGADAPPVTPPASMEIFNGKDLAGWSYIAGELRDIAGVASVKDGVIAVIGRPNGYLEIAGARENYALHVEWRWMATPGNGGILLNIASGPVQQNLWPRCFQVQLKTQRAGDVLPMGGATFAEPPTPQASPTAPVQKDRVADASEKPAGEWNSADIVCRGGIIEVSINGVAQNKVTGCDPGAGKIGFQLEGAPFELRHLKLTASASNGAPASPPPTAVPPAASAAR